MPAGKVSITVVVPDEVDGPAFETVITYWPVAPARNVPCATFVTLRSKLVLTGVEPVETGPLSALQPGHSFGFDTVALLAAKAPETPEAIITSRTKMLFVPDAIELAKVHVTFGTAPPHVQVAVEPALTEYPVTPAGSVSDTVVVPVVLDGPLLVTVILYCPMPPAVKVPCATFAMARSKFGVSGVGPLEAGPLLALQLGHSSGLDTVTKFAANGLLALAAMLTSSTSTLLPPDAIELEFVQVTFGTLPVQVQPGLEIGLTLYAVTPAGSVSATVVVPVE